MAYVNALLIVCFAGLYPKQAAIFNTNKLMNTQRGFDFPVSY